MPTLDGAIGPPKSLRKKAFAELVGLSPGRISQYITAGLPVDPDGRIDVAAGKLWIRENVSPTRSAAQSLQSDLPFAAQPDASAEAVRLKKEQADHAALKNQQLRAELVPAADVERAWSGILRQVRSGVLAVPSRVRQQLPHLTTHDIATFDAEIRRALEDLANAS
jgi:phage terminase Nu1 subunit (DNA packaging protein)